MNIAIDKTRLAQITRLDKGAHTGFEHGMCAMEAAAYIAGEPWSDHPRCVCPVIAAFMRNWNDNTSDADRNRLILPLVELAAGTRGSDVLAERRATMATDWLVRIHTPAWLRLAGLNNDADTLSNMPEITDFAKCPPIKSALEAAKKNAAAAWDATRAAAGDAAGAAAWDATRAAARDAAGAAAWAAAGDAARAAAWAAAWDAAWDATRAATRAAAGDAAGDALKSTVMELQDSASDLVRRMCALTD